MPSQMTIAKMRQHLDGFRDALLHPVGAEVAVVDDSTGERVVVQLVPDGQLFGMRSHVLRVHGGRGQRYYEGEVAGLDAAGLAEIVVTAFRNAEKWLPS